MHFQIRFRTEYVYDAPVTDNLNALRVRPATTSGQRCDEFTVRIEPEARVGRHSDYFGTEVLEFGIVRPHKRLTIDVRARVVTAEPAGAARRRVARARHRRLRRGRRRVPAAGARRGASGGCSRSCAQRRARTRRSAPCRACAATSFPTATSTARARRTSARPSPSSSPRGRAYCQDYVHLALILLRRNGIAARYVSGYLWAAPADEGDDSVEVETHAWLEALLPGENGRGEPVWVGADPTNRRLAGERHVKIGHGRCSVTSGRCAASTRAARPQGSTPASR